MTTIRPTAREPVRPMTGRNPLPQSLREYRLRRKSVKAAQSEAGSIQVAVPDFSLRADSRDASVSTAGVRSPRHEEDRRGLFR